MYARGQILGRRCLSRQVGKAFGAGSLLRHRRPSFEKRPKLMAGRGTSSSLERYALGDHSGKRSRLYVTSHSLVLPSV
jgi:hypothetical protein